jgi:hypothetical protein
MGLAKEVVSRPFSLMFHLTMLLESVLFRPLAMFERMMRDDAIRRSTDEGCFLHFPRETVLPHDEGKGGG